MLAAREDRERHAMALVEKRVRSARTELDAFIELCVKDEDGNHIRLDAIHRAWIWHLEYCWSRNLMAMILAPWGAGKSSSLAVPLAAWLAGRNPQIRQKFVSNADEFAAKRVQAAKSIIESPEYRMVFPGIRKGKKWGDHEIEVARRGHSIDPTIMARGVKTTGVGLRADVLIFDDVCDELNVSSGEQRRLIKNRCRNTWLGRLDQRHGRVLWIATPWHPDDATHDFWHDPRFCVLRCWVLPDHEQYGMEVFNAGPDYEVGRPVA